MALAFSNIIFYIRLSNRFISWEVLVIVIVMEGEEFLDKLVVNKINYNQSLLLIRNGAFVANV